MKVPAGPCHQISPPHIMRLGDVWWPWLHPAAVFSQDLGGSSCWKVNWGLGWVHPGRVLGRQDPLLSMASLEWLMLHGTDFWRLLVVFWLLKLLINGLPALSSEDTKYNRLSYNVIKHMVGRLKGSFSSVLLSMDMLYTDLVVCTGLFKCWAPF